MLLLAEYHGTSSSLLPIFNIVLFSSYLQKPVLAASEAILAKEQGSGDSR